MGSIREWLKGKKTFLVGISTIIGAIIAWSQGGDLSVCVQAIITAVLAMTVRAGVTNG